MPEPCLSALRDLRARARKLSRNALRDLTPFAKPNGIFRRTPDSPSQADDVNVTTTCSCLMALALTNKFKDFFKQDPFKGYFTCEPDEVASQILGSIVHAPWMSSGLTANNAFTTTLVIRTFGFLEEEGLLSKTSDKSKAPSATGAKQDPNTRIEPALEPDTKEDWHLLLGIRDASGLADALIQHSDRPTEFLWLSLSDKTRDLLGKTPRDIKKVHSSLAVDIARVLESGWIYDEQVFDKASAITLTRLEHQKLSAVPNAYKLAQANHLLLVDQFPQFFETPIKASLAEIAKSLAATPDNFTINKYPASAPVLYWFVDGVSRARLALKPEHWTEICDWATKRFNHERSLVSAEHDAMMDPVAMGMAACLCARLRSISEDADLGTNKEHVSILPSMVELQRSVSDLMRHQAESGIFPKYFPMFHYQDAGSNFCFTFELLEAVLNEFGDPESKLLATPEFIEGLSKAITWCEDNWLYPLVKSGTYTGWNSERISRYVGKGTTRVLGHCRCSYVPFRTRQRNLRSHTATDLSEIQGSLSKEGSNR